MERQFAPRKQERCDRLKLPILKNCWEKNKDEDRTDQTTKQGGEYGKHKRPSV